MTTETLPDFFTLFGLPRSYRIDRSQLDERYRELQRLLHPDRFVNAGDTERRLSAQQATRINEGYQTLRDPLLRGRYLLELAGTDHDDEHRTTRDTGFLMEQMELREALADVRTAPDRLAALGAIQQQLGAEFERLTTALADVLDQPAPDQVAAAGELLMKMQFYRRLQDEAVELEIAFEDELA